MPIDTSRRSWRVQMLPLLKLKSVTATRFMRFVTAAYGVEMIRSAIDREVTADDLKTYRCAIACHTGVSVKDVRYIYAKDDGHTHILHHFAAVDRKSKSIVLALRGTLSLSGAILDDIQGMARDFCLGFAHHGMSEMAEEIWEVSGSKIKSLLDEEGFKDYGLIITGNSLGAGVSFLLNIMCHINKLVGDRMVLCYCYAFAPPPTYFPCNPDATGDEGPIRLDLLSKQSTTARPTSMILYYSFQIN